MPSPGSADGAITVGSVNDKNTILRDDDEHSDFSNWGPRLSDGDDDEWDELKPDITSYGHNIVSATYGTSLPIPGDAGLADDQYDSKSGTSMATPIASGVVALMLEVDSSLTPQEVKDILRTVPNKGEILTTNPCQKGGMISTDLESSMQRVPSIQLRESLRQRFCSQRIQERCQC